MMIPKTLVITSCAGEKKYQPFNRALARDLDDFRQRRLKEKELATYQCKASEFFISAQNQRILEGISSLSPEESNNLALAYISDGYGYLTAEDNVIPYEISFAAMSSSELDDRAEFLRIHEETSYHAKNFDLVFFILSQEYLRALKLPLNFKAKTQQIFFVSYLDEKMISQTNNTVAILLGAEEAQKMNVKLTELKGYIFQLICQKQKKQTNFFNKIYENPLIIKKLIKEEINLLHKDQKNYNQMGLFETKKQQLNMFENLDNPFDAP